MKKKIKDFLDESNKIEGVYNKDSLNQAILAWEYLEVQKKLTHKVILKTHKILMQNQDIEEEEKGRYRKCQVWIGSRMGLNYPMINYAIGLWHSNVNDVIINGQKENKEFLKNLIKEQHKRYEEIHPFIDGNGRTGRMFMNWTRLKAGLPILVIKESEKDKYYKWFR